ncbi:long-chain-acyl-CoA synthetase [uncultured Halovibrio sp.]|uniref:long-chain-acyl-CoA synthetase n=1 Tax=uncultured Halovibrio sp. TaxID=985049 RepID=UPI0025DF8A75|nr:long-chain-acyl-CoA synthetase [uncultured Halovibrio sp.]
MTTDQIRATDVIRKVPGLIRKAPYMARGLYYYSMSDDEKAQSIGTFVERNARRHSENAAIHYGEQTLTWHQFNQWANQYAHWFRSQGLKRGDTIGVLLENRPELLAVVTGAGKMGIACAMLNTSQKGDVLVHSIGLVEPEKVVVGEELLDTFEAIRDRVTPEGDNTLLYLADRDARSDFGDAPEGYTNLAEAISTVDTLDPAPKDPPRLGDTAVYIYTSGTTGLPKAAPSSHRKFFKASGSFGLMALNMTPDDVLYCSLPFYHGTALLVCWGSVLSGASSLVMKRRFSASRFWDDVRYYGATTFGYVGELCRYLLNQPATSQDRNHPLRKMIGNGLRPSIWNEFKERFGIEQVAEFYASSEGNIGFTNVFNLDCTVGMSTAPYKLVKVKEGTKEPIRDNQSKLQEVAKGEPGLLIGEINQKWNFEGYTRKEDTEKSIIRDAFKKGDAWFNTGDIMRDIGWRHLQFVDRMGDTFRWKGENVSTNEVENIIDGFGGFEDIVVYGVAIPGHDGKAGMATLVPRDQAPDLDALHRYLKDNLPPYAVPVFLRLTEAIETTGTFKYKKTDLQKQAWHPGDEGDQVFALLPGGNGYQELDKATVAAIDRGEIAF